MLIQRRSIYSGKMRTKDLDITREQWDQWLEGNTFVQDCFPQLNEDDREFILSGMTPEEWDEIYPDEEEDISLAQEDDDEPAF